METFNLEDSKLPTNVTGKSNSNGQMLHGLLDPVSGRLYCLSIHYETIQFLSQFIGDSIFRINRAVSGRESILVGKISITSPWFWRFNPESRKLVEDLSISEQDSYAMRIIAEKASVLDLVNSWVNARRQPCVKTNAIQYFIYQQKKQEAESFIADPTGNYSYLQQYAEIQGIPLNEAAGRILTQSLAQEQIFLSTERLRLKYQKAVVNLSTIAEITALKLDFFAERADQAKNHFYF